MSSFTEGRSGFDLLINKDFEEFKNRGGRPALLLEIQQLFSKNKVKKGTANIPMRAVPDIIEPGGRLKQLSHYFKIFVSTP
jgi:hypothetical protein